MTRVADSACSQKPLERRAGNDRRGPAAKRLKVVLAADMLADDQSHRLIVTSISTTGLAGKTAVKLKVGETVEIALGGTERVAATVAWIASGRMGLEFGRLVELERHLPPGISSENLYEALERRATRIAQLELERTGRLAPTIR